jgi:hypothetical protein
MFNHLSLIIRGEHGVNTLENWTRISLHLFTLSVNFKSSDCILTLFTIDCILLEYNWQLLQKLIVAFLWPKTKLFALRVFEIILFQTQSLSIKVYIKFSFNSFIKNIFKRFAKRLWLNLTLGLNWSLYAYNNIPNIVWEIDNFVIKSDIFRGFFNYKNVLNKIIVLPWQLYFKFFMFGKYNGFISKARVAACMYFLRTTEVLTNQHSLNFEI